jgi:dolichyl-diphosphooligosaccharide---protein glycosyltransferase
LYWNGYRRFFTWFDTTVWYPLGRPVGTTIYPGMQFIAVWIKHYIMVGMSLNDICCYIPAWFGVVTTIITGAIAYECTLPMNTNRNIYSYLFVPTTVTTRNDQPTTQKWWTPAIECAILTSCMMAIVPAHLMRSMGGGYDNESVAVTAMVLTFYGWMRGLRRTNTVAVTLCCGVATGLAYFYMAAAWGGYVFVLNLIGVHAAVLVLMGRYTPKVYLSYTLFYVIGTTLAMQIPVVGWVPLKSLEQLGPCLVFVVYQLLFVTEYIIQQHRRSSNRPYTWMQAMILRIQITCVATFVLFVVAVIVLPTGYFGPISSRVRGLFVKHTKTGNPLVDSVAEHQPASTRAYFDYLHHICSIAPVGYIIVALFHMSDTTSFLLVWGAAAYFFSLKMVRLVLLTAPIACILGGIVAGRVIAWCIAQWWDPTSEQELVDTELFDDEVQDTTTTTAKGGIRSSINIMKDKRSKKKNAKKSSGDLFSYDGLDKLRSAYEEFSKSNEGVTSKRFVSVILLGAGYFVFNNFVTYSWRLSNDLSHPTIIQKGRTRDGQVVTLDDYRDAYWWLRDNTPEDSRIMAWWDCTCIICPVAILYRHALWPIIVFSHFLLLLLSLFRTIFISACFKMAIKSQRLQIVQLWRMEIQIITNISLFSVRH